MTIILLLVLSIGGASAQSVSISGKVSLSGKVQTSATESCIPTATQLANQVSTAAIALPTFPSLPAAGGKYCDPTYGREILRVSDDSSSYVNVVGQVAFNKPSTRLATLKANGTVRIYSIDPARMTTSSGTDVAPIVNAVGGGTLLISDAAYWWSLSTDADAANTLLFVAGVSLYKIDVTALVSGNFVAYEIANFGSLLTGLTDPYLRRCSASATTMVIGCAVGTPAAYKVVGYLIATLLTHDAGSPTTNWTTKKKFINGTDSASLSDYQTVTRTGSDMVNYTYALTSPIEAGYGAQGGYKFWVDRSGEYGVFPSYSVNDSGVASGQYNTQAIVNLNTSAITFMQAAGHGDVGVGYFAGVNSGYGDCATCTKIWPLADMTTDPATASNNGTALTGSMGYNIGRQYTSSFSNIGKSVVFTSCVIGGCPATPDAYVGEIFTVGHGGVQDTRRLVRTNHYLISSAYKELQPAMSPDGLFVAYMSNWGETSVEATNYVFITRVP